MQWKSARSVVRDATRAKALGPDLDRIAGTSLDKDAELDALAAMPAPERQAIISRAASGEEVQRLTPDARARAEARLFRTFANLERRFGPLGYEPAPREFTDTGARYPFGTMSVV